MGANPFEHSQIDANDISIHTASLGEGPLVVFCHGFPECWYSWRHQLPVIAAAGFRAVALDMRGYGATTAPETTGAYTLSHMVGDVVGVVAALGESEAVVVGHDWGAPIAWYSALMRPDVFRAVVGMSVPYVAPAVLPPGVTITSRMRQAAGPDRNYYRLYFEEPGVAEADLEADVYRSVRGFLYSVSGDVVTDGVFGHGWDGYFPVGQDFMQQLVVPEALPAWLSEADVKFYGSELTRSGFHGGLSHLCAVVVHLRRKRSHRRQPARPGKVADFVTGSTRRARTARRGSLDTTRASAAGQRRRRRIPNLAVIPPRHRRLGRAEPKKTLRTSHVTHRRDTDSRHNNA
jgi:pimeloyl-ACP methyl ester carboxylesterase